MVSDCAGPLLKDRRPDSQAGDTMCVGPSLSTGGKKREGVEIGMGEISKNLKII